MYPFEPIFFGLILLLCSAAITAAFMMEIPAEIFRQ